jgi:aminopeptidase 2
LTSGRRLFPEWNLDIEFINMNLAEALQIDAKLSSHPIEVDCPDAKQINQIFDSLCVYVVHFSPLMYTYVAPRSYSKAASVLRMLSSYVGAENFLKGVSLYLKKHLYSNTVSLDLWKSISEAAGLDVTDMMRIWVGEVCSAAAN